MRKERLLGVVTGIGLFACAETALAQQEGEFSVQRFESAMGANNFLSVQRARMSTQFGWTAGLMFNYAREPFVVVSCIAETNCDEPNASNVADIPVVSDMLQWDLMGTFNPVDFLQIGLKVPLAFVNGSGINLETGQPLAEGLSGFGMGDPVVEGKIRIPFATAKELFNLGFSVNLGFPLGHATAENTYIGNDSPVAVGWKAIADVEIEGFQAAVNLGGIYRGEASLATTVVGPVEFRYGVGAGYAFSPIFRIMAEGFGSTQFSGTKGTNTLEIDGGVEFTPMTTGLQITAGGGPGVVEGVGVPLVRGILGLRWSAEVGDEDGDGVGDDSDACKTIREDEDNFEDSDGCPEDDNDKDNIPDKKDGCPNEPETINGFQDTDGCPDKVSDRDVDGIPDDTDKCPDAAGKLRTPEFYGCPDADEDGVPDTVDKCVGPKEDTDGFEDTDGCPDLDNDKDGVPDDSDECGDEPEIMNGFQDTDGCPDTVPDSDKDGIPDNVDKCPNLPENLNGVEDTDGCPDKGVSLVEVKEGEIKILQRVEFATSSDKIDGRTSFLVLDAVVSAMKNNPQIFLVEVAGHTDNTGDAAQNKELSQKRADAVKVYIVGKGVADTRLKATGYGQDKPVADNKTKPGQQKNRRVEFNILRSTTRKAEEPATPAPASAPKP